jgi:hypothetical protein
MRFGHRSELLRHEGEGTEDELVAEERNLGSNCSKLE